MSELLEKILDKKNMNEAYKKVCANKGAGGVDGMEIEELDGYIRENWDSIREQIRGRNYRPQPVRRVEIPKPNGSKRKLGIPTVMDRVIQQGIAQVISLLINTLSLAISLQIKLVQKTLGVFHPQSPGSLARS